jgi:hypothetical protein
MTEMGGYTAHVTKQYWFVFKKGVPNLGAESGVSDRTRLLPRTLTHVLVVLHNTLPTGHETSHNGCTHQGEDVAR